MMRFIAILLLVFPLNAMAVQPDEIMKKPEQEARARVISKQLRCLVCQGEDIDESQAGLARDLRLLVRQRILSGDTDAEVVEHIRLRYGDHVMLKPPVDARTMPLWLVPFAVMIVGGAMIFTRRGKRRKT